VKGWEDERTDDSDPEDDRKRDTGLEPFDLNSRTERLFPVVPENEELRSPDRTELLREAGNSRRVSAVPLRVEDKLLVPEFE